MNSTVDISILICTHNSASRIEKTLSHIKAQECIDDISIEVLVVDYESSDDTLGVAKRIWGNHNIQLNLICESLPGKTPALETGFRQAKGVGICIIDDDNWIKNNYIYTANKILKVNSDVGIIGAFGLACCEGEIPVWFLENQSNYAVGSQADKSGYVNNINRLWFWGAGSVVRRTAWIEAKERGFVPILNPTRGVNSVKFKKGFTGGEDPELCYAIQIVGYKLWYEDSLIYTHYIPSVRLTKEYLNDTSTGVQAAAPIVRLYLSELYQNSFVGKFRKFVYQRWILHLIYICYIYQKLIFITCFTSLKDKPLRISIINKTYISQFTSLMNLRKDFYSIVKSIKKLHNKKTNAI